MSRMLVGCPADVKVPAVWTRDAEGTTVTTGSVLTLGSGVTDGGREVYGLDPTGVPLQAPSTKDMAKTDAPALFTLRRAHHQIRAKSGFREPRSRGRLIGYCSCVTSSPSFEPAIFSLEGQGEIA